MSHTDGALVMRVLLKRLLSKLALVASGGYSLRPWLHRMRVVHIDKNVWIGQFVYIDEIHPERVVIKENAAIGFRCTIFAHFYVGGYDSNKKVGKVVIEKDAFIGPNCTILQDVTIGEGSVVVAGSVVTRNVPPGILYGPTPSGPLDHPSFDQRWKAGLRKFSIWPEENLEVKQPATNRL